MVIVGGEKKEGVVVNLVGVVGSMGSGKKVLEGMGFWDVGFVGVGVIVEGVGVKGIGRKGNGVVVIVRVEGVEVRLGEGE